MEVRCLISSMTLDLYNEWYGIKNYDISEVGVPKFVASLLPLTIFRLTKFCGRGSNPIPHICNNNLSGEPRDTDKMRAIIFCYFIAGKFSNWTYVTSLDLCYQILIRLWLSRRQSLMPVIFLYTVYSWEKTNISLVGRVLLLEKTV